MKNSMRDQLLRAGVASKKQAQKAGSEQRRKKKQARKNRASSSGQDKDSFKLQQEKQAARDRELNRQRQAEKERRAIAAQIRQLIEMNRLSRDDGEIAYNFADGKTVRKLYVTQALHKQLGRGRLSIVRLGEAYEIVPKAVADKISERDASVVVSSSQPEASEEDELYADYAVPDDLMW